MACRKLLLFQFVSAREMIHLKTDLPPMEELGKLVTPGETAMLPTLSEPHVAAAFMPQAIIEIARPVAISETV